MRKAALCMAFLFVALIALPMAGEGGEKKAVGPTHDMTATIVSVNLEAKTISFKTAEGKEMTAPVLEEGMGALKKAKAGEKVVLTCLDDEAGSHKGVSDIKPSKA